MAQSYTKKALHEIFVFICRSLGMAKLYSQVSMRNCYKQERISYHLCLLIMKQLKQWTFQAIHQRTLIAIMG